MFERPAVGRFGGLAACVAAFLLSTGVAKSQTCTGAYEAGKRSEEAGALLEARDHFAGCARKVCGPFLLNECTTRHARLDTDIPSVVLLATDAAGELLPDVQVTMDGQPFAGRLDGRSSQVDPGMHEFVFRSGDGTTLTQKVMVTQGDRNRRVAVSTGHSKRRLPVSDDADADADEKSEAKPAHAAKADDEDEAPSAPSEHKQLKKEAPKEVEKEASPSKGVPAASWVLTGVGALGLGSALVFNTWGRRDNDLLAQSCGKLHACLQSSVNHVKRNYVIADISAGVGVAALTGAVLAYAFSGPSKENVAAQQAYRVDVEPVHSGAVASVSGSF